MKQADSAPAVNSASRPSSWKPRVGFLGLGWIGYQRMKSMGSDGHIQIAAVADPSNECLAKALEYAPDATSGRTLDDLLRLDLDGLIIATPSAQHAHQTIRALEKGIAVFCQKPLGRNGAEVRDTVAAARCADRLLGVDLSYRFTDPMQKIRSLIQSGQLGDIFSVELTFHNAYGPQKPWFYNPAESGGGCVVDLGIHLVDSALWILQSPVVDVYSRVYHKGSRVLERGTVCEDFASAHLQLATGATVKLNCSWNLHAGRDAVIEAAFYGTKGGAAMRNVNGSFTEFIGERYVGTALELISEPPDDWGGRAATDWARRLSAGGGRFDPQVEEIVQVTAVLDTIYERAGAR